MGQLLLTLKSGDRTFSFQWPFDSFEQECSAWLGQRIDHPLPAENIKVGVLGS